MGRGRRPHQFSLLCLELLALSAHVGATPCSMVHYIAFGGAFDGALHGAGPNLVAALSSKLSCRMVALACITQRFVSEWEVGACVCVCMCVAVA